VANEVDYVQLKLNIKLKNHINMLKIDGLLLVLKVKLFGIIHALFL
jgi:hypothetical protein